jgi:hypothetical protein
MRRSSSITLCSRLRSRWPRVAVCAVAVVMASWHEVVPGQSPTPAERPFAGGSIEEIQPELF